MPFRDRTGPNGKGPMTGREAGDCTGNNNADKVIAQGRGFGRGRGFGFRFGRGQGFGPGFGRGRGGSYWDLSTPVSPEQETNTLETQAQYLQDTLQSINERLKKLKGSE